MEVEGGINHKKKQSIFKKLEKYLSSSKHRAKPLGQTLTKSKSWHSSTFKKAPTGCFSVYVGPEKQRFVIKTEFVNHPLFKMLLEDAELEYGFNKEGPILLPCEVDLFAKILAQLDSGNNKNNEFDQYSNCGFIYGSCSPFNPARRLGKSDMAKGCGSYGELKRPRSLKISNYF